MYLIFKIINKIIDNLKIIVSKKILFINYVIKKLINVTKNRIKFNGLKNNIRLITKVFLNELFVKSI